MDNRAGEMAVFVRVIEAANFSEAARHLRMTPSTVSKLVARLEERLGVRLVERSTRRLVPTKEGQFYYERSRALLDQLDETEQMIARDGAEPEGCVRVSSSVSFGSAALEPILPSFFAAHPRITIDLSLSDEVSDLYLDRTDVAIRVGGLADSGLMSRKIGQTRRCIVAAPAYLATRGAPQTAEELAAHNCLGFNFRRANPVWPMRESGRIVERMLSGSLLANNAETLRRMAVAGVGIARIAEYHVRELIARGELVELLADSAIASSDEIHAYIAADSFFPPAYGRFWTSPSRACAAFSKTTDAARMPGGGLRSVRSRSVRSEHLRTATSSTIARSPVRTPPTMILVAGIASLDAGARHELQRGPARVARDALLASGLSPGCRAPRDEGCARDQDGGGAPGSARSRSVH